MRPQIVHRARAAHRDRQQIGHACNSTGSPRTATHDQVPAVRGLQLYRTAGLDGSVPGLQLDCVTCHTFPTGTNGELTSADLLQESQSFKIPQLRNLFEKTGFSRSSTANNRGFGFIHDGSVESLFSFLEFDGFSFAGGAAGDQQRRDVEAFMMSSADYSALK